MVWLVLRVEVVAYEATDRGGIGSLASTVAGSFVCMSGLGRLFGRAC